MLGYYLKAPEWLLITLALFLGLCVVLFVGAYIYLLINNPDALRSETYTLQKIALEKGLFGDSISGTIDINPDSYKGMILPSSTNGNEDEA